MGLEEARRAVKQDPRKGAVDQPRADAPCNNPPGLSDRGQRKRSGSTGFHPGTGVASAGIAATYGLYQSVRARTDRLLPASNRPLGHASIRQ